MSAGDILNATYIEPLKNIADELDRLAGEDVESTGVIFYTDPKSQAPAAYQERIHKKLIEINPEIQEFIIRAKNFNPDLAETVSKEYKQLLRLTEEPRDPELVKTHLCSQAKGLRRIIEVISKEFTPDLETVRQTAASGGKADLPNEKTAETGKNADKIIGDKFNFWGLEIHWRVLWNKLKKPMTNLKTFLRRDK